MRTEPHFHPGPAGAAVIRPKPAVALADPVTLTPVDRVTLTTLVDNSPDLLLPDQGPVRQHTRLVAVATACCAPDYERAQHRSWTARDRMGRRRSTRLDACRMR